MITQLISIPEIISLIVKIKSDYGFSLDIGNNISAPLSPIFSDMLIITFG